MAQKEYLYIGGPIPQLSKKENAAFLLNLQRALIASLKKRGLLTASQHDRCMMELERQYQMSAQHDCV